MSPSQHPPGLTLCSHPATQGRRVSFPLISQGSQAALRFSSGQLCALPTPLCS